MVGELLRAAGQAMAVLRPTVLALCFIIRRLTYHETVRVKYFLALEVVRVPQVPLSGEFYEPTVDVPKRPKSVAASY